MNLEWERNWLSLFNGQPELLLENYPEEFEYEDLNLGIRIVNDKPKLARLFKVFENSEPNASIHIFEATRYHGSATTGCVEWTWEINHKTDFMGLPTAGITTKVNGMTIHGFKDGKIILERSLWDTASLMRQAGKPSLAEKLDLS